jgi:glycosyltransferase involved in cell wall biosynthesis
LENLKVILITNIISPYRIPLFNAISKDANFDFKVVALAEREKNREWQILKEKIKFDYQVLFGWHWFFWGVKREVAIHLNRGVFKMLFKNNPDIVITSGYDSLAYWQAFLYGKVFRKKFILWNETTLLSVGSLRGIRKLLKKIIIKGSDKYIASGVEAKKYLGYLGAEIENIHISISTVDVNYFRNTTLKDRNNKDYLRRRKKYPEYLILYVGQLIKRKGIIQVLKALDNLRDPEIGLIIVGSGPQEKELKKFCEEKNLNDIFFEGFQQQEMLPKYYALADIFILPSFEEVWGLVVNEALASGLYVLSSKYAGASYDLIKEGWNGEIFDPNDIAEIVDLIKRIKGDINNLRKQRDSISQNACKEFNIENSAQEFVKAIKEVF